jgi:capsular exopolysaccharide synthesis family protein
MSSLVPRIAVQPPDHHPEPVHVYPHTADDTAKIFLIDVLAAMHRHRRLALTVGLLTAAVVIGWTLALTPQYQSTASIMLDTRREQVVDMQAVLSNLPSDTFVVDSEVQVLQSPSLALRVVDKLHLDQDPEFNATLRPATLLSVPLAAAKAAFHTVCTWIGIAPATDVNGPARRKQAVVQAFEKNLTVSRQGLTYVINIGFYSQDAGKAVRIANAVAETYLEQQKAIKADATRQANTLIQRHVSELREQVAHAEQAVADYKSRNGLLNAVGAPLSEQEISALNTQMATAQAEEAEQAGKLAAARQQLGQGGSEAVGQAAGSDTIRQLRQQQAELITQEADLAKRYGPKHPALAKVHAQRAALDAAIATEVHRVISGQQAEASAAASRAASLRASIDQGRKTLALNNAASVKLAELERDATAVRGVYESFLNRLKQTAAQEDLQDADAQIVSRASIPLKPSSPSWLLAAAAAMVFSLLAAGAAILLREFFDRGVRSPDEAESAVGMPVIATIPQISNADPAAYVVKRPMSDFAESIRNLRTSLFLSRNSAPPKVVAMMSALPHEGKTTTTLALGRQCAEAGARVLIIDADMRRRALTAHLERPVAKGLVELVEGRASLDSCLQQDTLSNAMILPIARSESSGKDVFFAHDLGRVFDLLRTRFDIVLVDTAPLLPLAEPRLVASHADSIVLLTRWHKTSQTAMQDAARLIRTLDVPVAGVALTCADMKLLDSFGYAARNYGQRAGYAKYYVQ